MSKSPKFLKYKIFLPMVTALIMIIFFAIATKIIVEQISPLRICCDQNSDKSKYINHSVYFLFPISIALFFIQLFVIFVALVTVRNRTTSTDVNVTFCEYLYVVLSFSVLSFAVYCYITEFNVEIFGFESSIFSEILNRIPCENRNDLFRTAECIKMILELMAILAITSLFGATCSLVPVSAWSKRYKNWYFDEKQIVNWIKWLNNYFYIAVAYLLFGGAFQVAYVRWLVSNMSGNNPVNQLGIVFFNTSLYVFLLIMILLPSVFRIMRAISLLEEQETKGMSEAYRRSWRLRNGFPNIDFANSMKYTLGIFSPFMVPILSLIFEA